MPLACYVHCLVGLLTIHVKPPGAVHEQPHLHPCGCSAPGHSRASQATVRACNLHHTVLKRPALSSECSIPALSIPISSAGHDMRCGCHIQPLWGTLSQSYLSAEPSCGWHGGVHARQLSATLATPTSLLRHPVAVVRPIRAKWVPHLVCRHPIEPPCGWREGGPHP